MCVVRVQRYQRRDGRIRGGQFLIEQTSGKPATFGRVTAQQKL